MTSEILSRLAAVEGVMFDVDGCLVISDGPAGQEGSALPGAAELIAQMRASGRRVCVFTNGTAQPPAEIAAHLRHLGLGVADEEVLTPAVAAARTLRERYGQQPVLAYGGGGVVPVLRAHGVNLIDPGEHRSGAASGAVAVLVGWDTEFTKPKLQFAAEAILAGATLYCTSDAPAFASKDRLNVGLSGFIVAGLSHVTGQPWTVLGKPSAFALETVCWALGTTTESTLVLGDDLYLEASMARRGGAVAGIVLTGMTTRERLADIPGDEMPEIVVESMTELAALFTDADELRMPVSTGLKR
ncbi:MULTISPECIES: HAD hydrolase-like protein [unclassified Microbacterium]|jgi:HAD superfamily hydrolase (TIGR01450 family)|uniref:HAD-IIA family hydrolase n=1 Tax=unclassified Microbacterium TaxID=2609290 RepID=UPI0026258ABB|nr:HAD hydrolase-like protein [Microbacterium sp.]